MKVVILGATGQISRAVIARLHRAQGVTLTLFGHDVSSRVSSDTQRDRVVNGDIFDAALLAETLQGQDLVFLNVPTAEAMTATAEAMKAAKVRRLIVSGTIGLYQEVGGRFGEWGKGMLASFARRQPERDAIEHLMTDPAIEATYIRMSMLYNNPEKTAYTLIPFGQQVTGAQVSREAVAHFISDIVAQPDLQVNQNVAIIETGSENLAKPTFY